VWYSGFDYKVESIPKWFADYGYDVKANHKWFANFNYNVTGDPITRVQGTGYNVVITGANDDLSDIIISMANFQMFLNTGNPSSVSLAIPNGLFIFDDVEARTNGRIIINKFLFFEDGTKSNPTEVAGFPFDDFDVHVGSKTNSLTLNGAEVKSYRSAISLDIGDRYMSSNKNIDDEWTVVIPPDIDVLPGDSLTFGGNLIIVDSLSFSVSLDQNIVTVKGS